MNPLTIVARHSCSRERRENALIELGCGVVFAALTILFFVK